MASPEPGDNKRIKWAPDKKTDIEDDEKASLMSGVKPTVTPAKVAEGPVPPALEFGSLSGPSPASYSNPAAPLDFSSHAPPTDEAMTRRPDDLQPLPEKYELWPAYPLKVACPLCGMYTMTTLEEETECVGLLSLCSDGPLFRDLTSHYCPRCRNRIGTHYTGRSCGRGLGCCHIQ